MQIFSDFFLQVRRVQKDCDGSVVDKIDLHIGSKSPCFDVESVRIAERFIQVFVERFGGLGTCCADERRPVSFAAIGVERELGDTKYLAADVMERKVHLARLVFEDAELCNFFRQEVSFGLGVAIRDAHQEHKTLPYFSDALAVYAHFRAGATLYYYSHIISWRYGYIRRNWGGVRGIAGKRIGRGRLYRGSHWDGS